MSVARPAYDGVETLNGKIYFVGGTNPTGNLAKGSIRLQINGKTLASMSEARAAPAVSAYNGKLYVFGGMDLTSVEIFDPVSGQWTAGASLPSEVNHGTAITVNQKILIIGGRNSSDQNINQTLEFDPVVNQWSVKAAMPTARRGAKLVLLQGKVWAIGGYTHTYSHRVEIYDVANNTWSTGPTLSTARHYASAWVSNGRIFVLAGWNPVLTVRLKSLIPTQSVDCL